MFRLDEAVALLERTPRVLRAWLGGLPDAWVRTDEGPGTWSPFDIVGHLIHGEKTDWIPRARIILNDGPARPFDPFDRFAMLEANRGRSLDSLLDEFEACRRDSLAALRALELTPERLALRGRHPALGDVTMSQLLATWTAHDLNHLHQAARVMARRYAADVGPWSAYLGVMKPR